MAQLFFRRIDRHLCQRAERLLEERLPARRCRMAARSCSEAFASARRTG
jgi:hypothetical protein